MININFKFRAVGQGAFYTGILKHDNGNQFSFVYDCGTHSSRQYVDREIDSFVAEIGKQKLDILFISHFHEDHINKIGELLNKTGGAKYAILPYLTPDELLVAYIDGSLSGGDSETLLFIQNPVQYLLDRKVEKIIFIHPSDDGDLNSSNDPDIKDPDRERVLSEDFEFEILNQLVPFVNDLEQNPQISHYLDLGRFSVVNFWEFKFFNKPRDFATITAFVHDVNNLLTLPHFEFKDLANYIDNNQSTFESNFNTIYSNNFGARQLINDTSLVIYHGPLIKINIGRTFDYKYLGSVGGTLLTGDIRFDQNCLSQIILKWSNNKYIKDVIVFQIPHHGADNYIEPIVITTYKNVYWWVINFGLGNTHKHPRQSIVDMINTNKLQGKIFANTQVNVFLYGGCIFR